MKVAQILIHECDKYKTIAQEQVNEKADVVVTCLDATAPLHNQFGHLLKSSPTLEQSLLIETGQKFILEDILRPSLALVLHELEALFTYLGDIPSDWKD